ncbi:MAG TPA: phosphoribosylamine--glycine ligase [Candidatus Paceibacterota bacterium]|nr:phosphoribosylamine--glycine ligase [Candidatus Paceibacterota bacterium]
MPTDVLIIGSGGREHALAWKLKQSPRIGKLYVAPGNAGTSDLAENVPIPPHDIEGLARFASQNGVHLTVVGPGEPLALGIVDLFRGRGLCICGPVKAAAEIESSKSFAKQLMREDAIPTATFNIFDSQSRALADLRLRKFPVVIKVIGLAHGKGVYICKTMEDAEQVLSKIMTDRVQGDAGTEVIVEDFLEGPEFSVHVVSDGIAQIMFPASLDHKRALDGDAGAHTEGMGAIAPVPWISEHILDSVQRTIVRPALEGVMKRGTLFEGVLYPGLILTTGGAKALEFNARFGDPETQVYMRLLESDLLDVLEGCVNHTLSAVPPLRWIRGYAVNVTLASAGYPDESQTGLPISGIQEAATIEGVVVFHGSTAYDDGVRTAGGRVLHVTAVDITPQDAINKAYAAVQKIHFEGMRYRTDIGASVVKYWNSTRV